MAGPSPELSVIVPTLNEVQGIAAALAALQGWRRRGVEVIVVDGESSDGTAEQARPWADRLLLGSRGRAQQMNAGARAACGRVLLFLHADTRLPPMAHRTLLEGLARQGHRWGRFDVRLSGADHYPLLRLVGGLMNLRSRWTGIATGDQALFVTRTAFDAAGGYPEIPIMEDIALSATLKRCCGLPLCLRERAITSSRRWEMNGVIRTIGLMWLLRLRYWLGSDPQHLATVYRRG